MLRVYRCAVFLLTLFAHLTGFGAEGNEYGLRFVSHSDIKDNRTSLNLTPDKEIDLKGGFTLSFEVLFGEELHTFGYVFRMIESEGENFDMVSDLGAADPKLKFIKGHNTVAEVSLTQPVYDRWVRVEVKVAPERVTFVVDSARVSAPKRIIDRRGRYRLWFGACDHPAFYTTDVPPMTLRDVRVADYRGKSLRHWQLGRNAGDEVCDATGRHTATVKNPVWLLKRYSHWVKKIGTVIPLPHINMAARGDRGEIYFAARDYLAVYDNSDMQLKRIATQNSLPFDVKPNQMVFDEQRQRLVAYEFESQTFSTIDPADPVWSNTPPEAPMPRYWQHNAAYVPQLGKIALFGGYGEHTYKSILNVIDPDGEWSTVDLSEKIPPRYLSGMAVGADGKLIVVGGFGNASGLQFESPYNFYDIWSLDLETMKAERIGEIGRDPQDEPFVLGRDMVLSNDGATLYALVYSDKRYASEIWLAGIDFKTGDMVRYADAVPYGFSDIESFCTLVFDRNRGEFLLVAMRQTSNGGTLVEIWSLKAPPLQIADTVQPRNRCASWTGWWLLAVIVAAVAAAGAIWIGRRRSRRRLTKDIEVGQADSPDYHKTYRVERRPSSILLLGGFQVIDKQGNDITGHFTQTVKALLMLILLETCKGGRGISSQTLRDTLWFEKDNENARNNRNVNIHKLRSLLAEVGDAVVSSSNSYWSLALEDGIFCDYSELLRVSNEISSEGVDARRVRALVSLASLGKMLPNIQTEWADAYKAEFTSRIIEQLLKVSAEPEIRGDMGLLLKIADAILVHDNLDEDAIRLKCSALMRLGKKHQAKQAYNNFVSDYERALDSTPDFNLSDILDPRE